MTDVRVPEVPCCEEARPCGEVRSPHPQVLPAQGMGMHKPSGDSSPAIESPQAGALSEFLTHGNYEPNKGVTVLCH